jgi:hypothetical protein
MWDWRALLGFPTPIAGKEIPKPAHSRCKLPDKQTLHPAIYYSSSRAARFNTRRVACTLYPPHMHGWVSGFRIRLWTHWNGYIDHGVSCIAAGEGFPQHNPPHHLIFCILNVCLATHCWLLTIRWLVYMAIDCLLSECIKVRVCNIMRQPMNCIAYRAL